MPLFLSHTGQDLFQVLVGLNSIHSLDLCGLDRFSPGLGRLLFRFSDCLLSFASRGGLGISQCRFSLQACLRHGLVLFQYQSLLFIQSKGAART